MEHYKAKSIQELKTRIESDKNKKNNEIGYSFLNVYRGMSIKTKTRGYRKKIVKFGTDAYQKIPDTQKTIKQYINEAYPKIHLKYFY